MNKTKWKHIRHQNTQKFAQETENSLESVEWKKRVKSSTHIIQICSCTFSTCVLLKKCISWKLKKNYFFTIWFFLHFIVYINFNAVKTSWRFLLFFSLCFTFFYQICWLKCDNNAFFIGFNTMFALSIVLYVKKTISCAFCFIKQKKEPKILVKIYTCASDLLGFKFFLKLF